MAVTLVLSKILALILIAAISLFCGILPYHLVKWFNSKGIFSTPKVRCFISSVICFSGGTLIGVAFLHLMPEMREKLKLLEKKGYNWAEDEKLPISDILTCFGFFFVYIFDEMMHMFIEWYSRNQRKKQAAKEETEMSSVEGGGGGGGTDVQESRSRRFTRHVRGSLFPCTCMTASGTRLRHPDGHNHNKGTEPKDPLAAPQVLSAHRDSHATVAANPLSGLITIVALSFHDIFEGLAIGIEEETNDVLFLYLSIAAHKYAIAFCIGLDLVLTQTRLGVIYLYMLTYSLVSPVGIVIGIFIVNEPSKSGTVHANMDSPVTVILQGLAGGTLIYVVCFEVLQREGHETHVKGICNVIFVLIGFFITLLFKIFLGHTHAHDDAVPNLGNTTCGQEH